MVTIRKTRKTKGRLRRTGRRDSVRKSVRKAAPAHHADRDVTVRAGFAPNIGEGGRSSYEAPDDLGHRLGRGVGLTGGSRAKSRARARR